MGRITTFLVAVALLTTPASASAAVSHEVNGAPATDSRGAALVVVHGGFCSGFVAGRRLVVTAAHCGPAVRVLTTNPVRKRGVRRTVRAPRGIDLEAVWLRSSPRWGLRMKFRWPALGSKILSFGFGLTDPLDLNSWGAFNVTAQIVIPCSPYLAGPARFCASGGAATIAEGDSGGPVMNASGYAIGINEGFSTINGDPATTMAPDVFVSLAPLRNWIKYQAWASR